ncbi:MAG: hypothetical protein FRX49_02886 [Trebouxia sp. A1-2]|nr:MAG: hypothetical protein FRX49_02886 [Trebouxia sp. A1-2]
MLVLGSDKPVASSVATLLSDSIDSVSLILQGGRLHKGEFDRREVLAQAQPQEHLNDKLARTVCQDIVPAPLYSQAQVKHCLLTCGEDERLEGWGGGAAWPPTPAEAGLTHVRDKTKWQMQGKSV